MNGKVKGRPKKYTTDFVKSFFIKAGVTPLFETYRNTRTPLEFVCSNLKCNKTHHVALGYLLKAEEYTFLCPECLKGHLREKFSLTLSEVIQIFKEAGLLLLSKEYLNQNQKLEFLCTKCKQNSFYMTYTNFRDKRHMNFVCDECSLKHLEFNSRFNSEFVKNWFLARGSKLLTEYQSIFKPLSLQCSDKKCFNSFKDSFKHLYSEGRNPSLLCPSCRDILYKRTSFSREFVENYFKCRNAKILKMGESRRDPIHFICSEADCENSHSILWNNLFNHEINSHLRCASCIKKKSYLLGELNPNFNFELTPDDRSIKKSIAILRWYEVVRLLYNSQTVGSTQKSTQESSHHIEPCYKDKDLILDLSNGVYLKKEDHIEYHSLFYKKESKETLNHYLKKKYNIEIKPRAFKYPILYNQYNYTYSQEFCMSPDTIPFYWHEVKLKKNIVLSMIRYREKIPNSIKTIFARKLFIIEISSLEATKFLMENHIQGSVFSGINIALTDGVELFSLLTLSKNRFKVENIWEILRFCSRINYSIPGAFSKLFKYFLNNFNKSLIPVVTFADKRFTKSVQNSVYIKAGFEYVGESKGGYSYTKDFIDIFSRIKYQKHKLSKVLAHFEPSLSEVQNMKMNGFFKIKHFGNFKFIYKGTSLSMKGNRP